MITIESIYFYTGILVSFILGINFGSFANVCIYRIPLDLSIVRPRSSCTRCKTMIAWYDNIPVFSYLILGGKCRHCGEKISLIYPVVELMTAFLFVFVFCKYGFSIQSLLFWLLTFSLVVISGIDIYHRVIPDIFPLILGAAGFALCAFNPALGESVPSRFLNSALGILAGGGVLFIVGAVGQFIYKKEAMGGGDVKLMAGVGAIIGWEKVLFAIFIASFIGSVAGFVMILLKKTGRKEYIPFGPFLSAAVYMTLFLPEPARLLGMFFNLETSALNKFIGL